MIKARHAPLLPLLLLLAAAPSHVAAACDTISLTGTPPAQTSRLGVYVLQAGKTTGGRPAYFNAASNDWMYYYAAANGWAAGSTLGTSSAGLYCPSSAQTPDAITSTWKVSNSEGFVDAPSVKASCVAPTPASTPAPTPPTPAPGTLGCSATVDPAAAAPLPAGTCVSIVPCLAAMPASCATKTLLLRPGRYTGPQNTRLALGGTDSVAIVGPAAPAPLRAGPGGAAELDAAPPAAAVATIDGEGVAWILAVSGSAALRLENVALARGRGGQFTSVLGRMSGGGALRVTGSGAVNATGVLFDSNTVTRASGSTYAMGGAVYTESSGAARFSGTTWRNNKAEGSNGDGGGTSIVSSSAASAALVAPAFDQCLFEGNSAGSHGGGTCAQNAAVRFSGTTWRNNKAEEIGRAHV